jgi:hypothetical protein
MSTDNSAAFIQSGKQSLNDKRVRELQAMRDALAAKTKAEAERKAAKNAPKPKATAQLHPYDSKALLAIAAVKARQAAVLVRIRIVALDRLLRAATAIVRPLVLASDSEWCATGGSGYAMLEALRFPFQPFALLPATVPTIPAYIRYGKVPYTDTPRYAAEAIAVRNEQRAMAHA